MGEVTPYESNWVGAPSRELLHGGFRGCRCLKNNRVYVTKFGHKAPKKIRGPHKAPKKIAQRQVGF